MGTLLSRRRYMGGKARVKDYLAFKAIETGTFTPPKQMEYSLDGKTWTTLAASTASPTVAAGEYIYWRGEVNAYSSSIGTFASTGQFNVKGHLMSLYRSNFESNNTIGSARNAGRNLFKNVTTLVNAEDLVLADDTYANCYYSMFQGCTNLVSAPTIPASTLESSSCRSMFQGCTSLVDVPDIAATTAKNSSCLSMFQGCTALVNAPNIACTSLETSAFNSMFSGCSNLEYPPSQLSATTMANGCYNSMFYNCKKLKSAPVVGATSLAEGCMYQMFRACQILETAPVLSATTLVKDCYKYMFFGCSKLNYIKAMFTTTPSTTYTDGWVQSVASSGTFVKNSSASWSVTGAYGVPTNWTIETASS